MGSEMCIRDSLKILGFHFGRKPNAVDHVAKLIDRMYGKLWTLRFLKRSGMEQHDLLQIYKTILRPSAEYSSVIYHSLIPEYLANKLESFQRQALKIIYGWDTNCDALIENGTIELLSKRRQDSILKFALKAAASPRFGPSWFKETPISSREVRATTRKKYIEKQCKTDRSRNNPLEYMTKTLNEFYSK